VEWSRADTRANRFPSLHRALHAFRAAFFATLNYVHSNPVHHGYVRRWTDWHWSSAAEYLESIGRDEAARLWKEYPVMDYGKKWDPSDL
jgi:putative transposase